MHGVPVWYMHMYAFSLWSVKFANKPQIDFQQLLIIIIYLLHLLLFKMCIFFPFILAFLQFFFLHALQYIAVYNFSVLLPVCELLLLVFFLFLFCPKHFGLLFSGSVFWWWWWWLVVAILFSFCFVCVCVVVLFISRRIKCVWEMHNKQLLSAKQAKMHERMIQGY